jgi:phosphoribosylanthranilate isomerase
MTRVKICGITNPEDAQAAIEAGADALGFILYPPSPRCVDLNNIWPWVSALPPFIQRVLVTVNHPPDDLVQLQKKFPFDVWQLHGDEPPEVCSLLYPSRTIKVIRLEEPTHPENFSSYPVDAFLLDTPTPEFGGSGRTFDWQLAAEFTDQSERPVILSGGLTPDNVREAVFNVRPYAVDVSSGVEYRPGIKDHAKVRDFIQNAKGL